MYTGTGKAFPARYVSGLRRQQDTLTFGDGVCAEFTKRVEER